MIESVIDNAEFNFKRTPLESALFQITECAAKSSSMERYAGQLHQIVKQLMYAENFFIVLYRQGGAYIEFIYIADEYEEQGVVQPLRQLPEVKLRRTLTGYMLASGNIQHLSSTDITDLLNSNVVDDIAHHPFNWLGAPLKHNDDIFGGIVIQSYQQDIFYTEKDISVLQFIALQIALVIKSKQSETLLIEENVALEKRVEERTQDLNRMNAALLIEVEERKKSERIQSALFQITELVSTAESAEDFYCQIFPIVSQLMPVENGYVALLSQDGLCLEFPCFVDPYCEIPESRMIQFKQGTKCLTEKVINSGCAYLHNRCSNCGDVQPASPEETTPGNDTQTKQRSDVRGLECMKETVSWLGVPLKDGNSVFGVLAIQSYEDDITYCFDNQRVLLTVAHQVSIAALRKRDMHSIVLAHEQLERRVRERTSELERTIERRRLIEKKLEYDALHDSLTGLPNRVHLLDTLKYILSEGFNEHKTSFALLFLDMDRFKIINDSLGHHIGDLFLIEVGKRLSQCLRVNDLVARLGGDEFCVLMPYIPDERMALGLCARILASLKKPIEIESNSLIASASIGVRFANSMEESAEEIMSDADSAMYQAKQQGKNQYCFFDSTIKSMVTNRMKMERGLRDAVSAGQLYLDYQPVINFVKEKIEGFEALLRWRHPESGVINPVEFIPVAEETGLILDIGEEVIRMACERLQQFKTVPALASLYINVNVSSVQILARTLDEYIRKQLLKYSIEPCYLNVEITESILIEDYKAALMFVRELKAMGIKVYLDDFGTGYSSLSYLHKFPFDVIKLDRTFISALDGSRHNEAIVESIGQLAKNLNIQIVAEGVETEKQLDVIRKMHYEVAQGYLFARPLPEKKIESFVHSFVMAKAM